MLDKTTGLNLDKRLGDWTPERTAILRQLWADGLSCSRIAMEIGGITRNAVIGKASRLGLQGRTPQTRKARYRSGPISHTEKIRRAAERKALNDAARAEREILRAERKKAQRLTHGHRFNPVPRVSTEETEPPAEFLAVTFGELKRRQCHYPRGEGEGIRFCGQPALAGHFYCKHCYRICHHTGPRHPLPLSEQGDAKTRVRAGEGRAQPARSSFAFWGMEK